MEGGSPVPTAAADTSLPPLRAAVEIPACPGAGAPRAVEECPGEGASSPLFPPDMLTIPPELSPVLVQPGRPESPTPLLQPQSRLFLLSPPGWATPPRPPTPSSEALRAFRSSPRAVSPMLPSLLDLCSETVADNLFSYESESESGSEDEKEGADAPEPKKKAGEASPEAGEASPERLREAVETAAEEEVAELIDAAVAAIAGTGSVVAEAAPDGEAGNTGATRALDDAPFPEDTENRALAAACASPGEESPEIHKAEVSDVTAEEQDEEALLLAGYRVWQEASAVDMHPTPAPSLVDVQAGVAADPAGGSVRSGATAEEAELLAEYQGWKHNLQKEQITAPVGEAAGDRAVASYEGDCTAFPSEEAGDGGGRARGSEPLEEVSVVPSGQPGQFDQLACAELPPELEQVFLADLVDWEIDLPAAAPGSAGNILETAASIISPQAAAFHEVPPVDGQGDAEPLVVSVEQPLPGYLPAAAELRRAGEVAAAEPLFADDAVVRALTSRLQACLAHLPGEEGGGQ